MMKILVVEDDRVQLDLYRCWIPEIIAPSSDIIVQFAVNGLEAKSLLNTNLYSLTFMDLALPYISGADLIKQFRANMGKLIVASSYASCYIIDGVDGILQKPFSSAEVAEVLRESIGDKVYARQESDSHSSEYSII